MKLQDRQCPAAWLSPHTAPRNSVNHGEAAPVPPALARLATWAGKPSRAQVLMVLGDAGLPVNQSDQCAAFHFFTAASVFSTWPSGLPLA